MKGTRYVLILTLLALMVVGTACERGEEESHGTSVETQALAAQATPLSTVVSPTKTPTVTPTKRPTPTPAPTATPTPVPIGQSRSNPVPVGEVYQTPNWEMQVLEVKRGDAAWVDIQLANRYSDPPSKGMEYVLVKLRVKNIGAEDTAKTINYGAFVLTGDRNLVYRQWSMWGAPKPELNAELYPGGETEGWLMMQAGAGESNLILMYEENWEAPPRFLALEEGAKVVPGTVEPCEGLSMTTRSEPAPLGEKLCAGSWEIQVLEVTRGADAWAALQIADDMNRPPDQGMEYILARLRVGNTGTQDIATDIGNDDFALTGDRSLVYRQWSTWGVPEPELNAELYPGGETEGWVRMQTSAGDSNPILMYEEDWDGNVRFLALEEGAKVVPGTVGPCEGLSATTRSQPAPFGERVCAGSWEIQVLEVVRGMDAWAALQIESDMNRPADQGMEYVLVKLRARNISSTEEPIRLSEGYFASIGDKNVVYDPRSVHLSSPAIGDVRYFPGGEYEGRLALQCADGESNLLAVLRLNSGGNAFLALQ